MRSHVRTCMHDQLAVHGGRMLRESANEHGRALMADATGSHGLDGRAHGGRACSPRARPCMHDACTTYVVIDQQLQASATVFCQMLHRNVHVHGQCAHYGHHWQRTVRTMYGLQLLCLVCARAHRSSAHHDNIHQHEYINETPTRGSINKRLIKSLAPHS